MRKTISLLILFLSLSFFKVGNARIIYVPSDSSTTQKGIEGATDGDTVLVYPGIYYERINFMGKKITVASFFILNQNPQIVDSTILDGSLLSPFDTASVVVFVSDEDSNSVLAGFTVRNGKGTRFDEDNYGGGIYCISSPTIFGNKITKNKSHFGGGIACMDKRCRARIEKNIITGDSGVVGGGIFVYDSSPTIRHNVVSQNKASYRGGGIFCKFAQARIEENEVLKNYAQAYGGGIYSTYSSPQIISNLVAQNEAKEKGGGEYGAMDSFSVVRRNIFFSNVSPQGGGVYFRNCSAQIWNNTIDSNSALTGGGLFLSGSYFHPWIINNIISRSTNGQGIFCEDGSIPLICYNDVWDNRLGNFTYCPSKVGDITWGKNYKGTPCDSFFNIILDPLIFLPDTDISSPNNFHISCFSPCKDAGDPSFVVPEKDAEKIDIGAKEYTPTLGNVNDDGRIDLLDLYFLGEYLLKAGPAPCPLSSSDVNCDDVINLVDLILLIHYVFENLNFPCSF